MEIHPSKDIPSPCVRNCCLNDNDICIGCHRTLEEIITWTQLSSKEKESIQTRITRERNALISQNQPHQK